MKTQNIRKIFETFSINNPSPRTELKYINHYTLLVSVVLSAQSTDKGVNRATQFLFPKYNRPEAMITLGVEGLKSYIKTIGLYNNKAKNIIALSKILVSKYNSIVPNTMKELLTLPGVGRKTANVVLACCFNKTTMAVDTHVGRVAQRIGFTKNKNPDKIEEDLLKIIPQKFLYHAHHWLILHGRYVCKSRQPLCQECQISKYCEYYKKL